jgi:hypothetical protein
MPLLDRWGKPMEQAKERPAIGFLDRTLPHREDFDVITGIQAKGELPLTNDNDPAKQKGERAFYEGKLETAAKRKAGKKR